MTTVAIAALRKRSPLREPPACVRGGIITEPCADHPWRQAVEEHFVARQLAAERRVRAAIEP